MLRILCWNKRGSTESCVFASAFDFEPVEQRSGFVALRISGNDLKIFADEAGGHRFQRASPTDKRGRIHSSTITVAILREPTQIELVIPEKDLEWFACRGSGAGGQHRNQTASAIQLRHIPTGLMVRCEQERAQLQNKMTALTTLRARLWAMKQGAADTARAQDRRAQIGSGMRADKRRTIRSDGVVDHVSGRHWSYKQYVRGDW